MSSNDEVQRIVDAHDAGLRKGFMGRYDDVASAHRALVNTIKDLHGDASSPHPLLKDLKGPSESRREKVRQMKVPEMRKAVEGYEQWYSVTTLTYRPPRSQLTLLLSRNEKPSRRAVPNQATNG